MEIENRRVAKVDLATFLRESGIETQVREAMLGARKGLSYFPGALMVANAELALRLLSIGPNELTEFAARIEFGLEDIDVLEITIPWTPIKNRVLQISRDGTGRDQFIAIALL